MAWTRVKFTSGIYYETPYEVVRATLNWESLQSRREKQMLLLMKETINGNTNNNLGDLFKISCNTSHNLRSNKVLSLAKANTKARFPLGDFFRAKRLFPLSASLITSANVMPTEEKVASREKSRLVENGLNTLKRSFSYKGAVVWNNLQLAEKL